MSHIDWLTIVGRRDVETTDYTVHHAYLTACEWLCDRYPEFVEDFGYPGQWQIVKPRAPYSFARRADDNTRTLYVHPLSAHFTLEVSGAHCQRIAHRMRSVLEAFQGCLSRVDIATDIETTVTPLQFDAKTNPARVNTRSRMSSTTGETVYVGSRSSERFCRVYRYNAPHPRAHLLRVEFQLKGDYANAAAAEVIEGVAINGLAAGLGEVFGFQHEAWQPDAEPSRLKVQTHAQSGATVYWLTTTVAPLMKRLQREGKLDIAAWFDEYVLK